MKFLFLEFASITGFFLSIFLYRHTAINNNELVQEVMFVVVFVLIILILIVIPALIILSFRDNVSPSKPINKNIKPFKLNPAEIAKYLVVFALSWIIFLIGKFNDNNNLVYLSCFIYLIGMPVLYKNRKQNYNKSFMILLFFILVGFFAVLILSETLFSLSLRI